MPGVKQTWKLHLTWLLMLCAFWSTADSHSELDLFINTIQRDSVGAERIAQWESTCLKAMGSTLTADRKIKRKSILQIEENKR